VVTLTLAFYRRNYIEGLFLSSGIIRSPNYTMEQMVEVARTLREDHDFRGYIHLKTIPDADPELVRAGGELCRPLSINVELPTGGAEAARAGQGRCADPKARWPHERRYRGVEGAQPYLPLRARFAPAGQSTQMIVGADGANDATIVLKASTLYDRLFKLRRVYYSAFAPSPTPAACCR
jgi:predicted DNA-binding helix-hairpin-helix protein